MGRTTKKYKAIDHGIIDVETHDQDDFFWSLMNQFQMCADLPISKRENALTETHDNEQNHGIESDNTHDSVNNCSIQHIVEQFIEKYINCSINGLIETTSTYIKNVERGLLSQESSITVDLQNNIITHNYNWQKELEPIDQFIENLDEMLTDPYNRSFEPTGEKITNSIHHYRTTINQYKRVFLQFVPCTRFAHLPPIVSQKLMNPSIRDHIVKLKKYLAKLDELYISITTNSIEG